MSNRDARGTDETVAASDARSASDASVASDSTVFSPTTRDSDPVVTTADLSALPVVDRSLFAIRGEIARGGMGRLLEARDRRLGRSVAIKEVIDADPSALVRFEREIRITARLQHPAIVHVHEAGRWPDGAPFFVMKLIRGEPLDHRIRKAHSLAERLELLPAVTTVIDALAYAHSERVIHRDLKPANVLVAPYGETMVIDWGIAKDLSADELDDLAIGPYRSNSGTDAETVDGAVIGTPSYMPPEQASGERVDERADVYALGALLYQVLAGVPPFTGKTAAEVLDKVLHESPKPLAEADPDIPVDLIAIVDKAMARGPEDRFATAGAMADELRKFQRGQLVTSRRYTWWELVRRWVSRHRAVVATATIAVAVLVIGGVISIWNIVAEKRRADDAAARATAEADVGLIARASDALDRDPVEALSTLKQLGRGSVQWGGARTIAADAASRGLSRIVAKRSDHPVYLLAFSPDGTHLAALGDERTLRVYDLTQPAADPTSFEKLDTRLFSIRFSDANTIVGFDFDGNIRRWKLGSRSGTLLRSLSFVDPLSAELSPDARRAVVLDHTDTSIVAVLTDLETGSRRELGRYRRGSWTRDGSALLLFDGNRGGHTDRYDLATGEITTVATNTGGYPAVGDANRLWQYVYIRSRRRGELRDRSKELGDGVPGALVVRALAMLPDGRAVFTSEQFTTTDQLYASDGTMFRPIDPGMLNLGTNVLRVVDARIAPLVLRGHAALVEALAVSPAGAIASGDHDGEIRVWQTPRIGRFRGIPRGAVSAAFLTRDRKHLVVARRGPRFEVVDLFSGARRRIELDGIRTPPRGQRITSDGEHMISEPVETSSDEVVTLVRATRGDRFATLDQGGRVAVWDLEHGGRTIVEHATRVAISPSGDRLLTMSDRGLQRWDVATGTPVFTTTDVTEIAALALDDRGTAMIATPYEVLRLEGDRLAGRFAASAQRVLIASPDGRSFAGGGNDGRVRVWNGNATPTAFSGHTGTVFALAFSPDGTRLASASADREVRVWNLVGGSSIRCGVRPAIATALDFDGDTVVSAGLEGTVQICDTRAGQSRMLSVSPLDVMFAGHVAGNDRIVAIDRFDTIVERADNLPRSEPLLRAWLDASVPPTP